ncbi:MAG: hypothetical protein ACI4N3_00615 [Alphaproteobacteria bacterium]
MKSNFIKIALFLLTSTPTFAYSECDQFKTTPKITTTINYGTPSYTLVPKEAIIAVSGLKNPLRTMGLTIADFQIQYSITIDKNPTPNGICVNINTIDFNIGYNSLDVIIDEKYKENTCQYNEIKKHEQGHINIYQEELKYYGKLITDEMKILIENLKPFLTSSDTTKTKINKKIDILLKNDEKLNILKNRLEQAIIDKNLAHDSDEEYIRIKNSCSSW